MTTSHELPPLAEVGAQLRRQRLTPWQLVQQCLARIEQLDSRLHAWVVVDAAGALARARQLTDQLAGGTDLGPLHGIPIGVKDIIDVAGLPTRAGSSVTSERPASRHAALVARLEQCGAVVLGKTVTTEFAYLDPPPTRNPWQLDRTPGGSSSGSAVAVATGMCCLALGSQTGGSIIRPATYCGICGFKPAWSCWPTDGVLPLSFHLDHVGLLARSADDVALACQALEDTVAASSPLPHAPAVANGAPRLWRWDGFFTDGCQPQVLAVVDQALTALQASGATVRRSDPPDSFAPVRTFHRRIMAVETAAAHRRWYADHRRQYGPRIRELVEEGLRVAALDYASALQHRLELQRELTALVREDVIVTPAANTTAPPADTTGDPSFNSPWSYLGWPTISIPCGRAQDGLPCGLQLVSRCAENLRQTARWCQQILPPLPGPCLG